MPWGLSNWNQRVPSFKVLKAPINVTSILNVTLPAVVVLHCVRCCTLEVDPAAGVGGAVAAGTEPGVAALGLGTSLHQSCPWHRPGQRIRIGWHCWIQIWSLRSGSCWTRESLWSWRWFRGSEPFWCFYWKCLMLVSIFWLVAFVSRFWLLPRWVVNLVRSFLILL